VVRSGARAPTCVRHLPPFAEAYEHAREPGRLGARNPAKLSDNNTLSEQRAIGRDVGSAKRKAVVVVRDERIVRIYGRV
jgi:hypothetical protein